MQTPSQRYQVSQRVYNPSLAPIEYQNGDLVRKVGQEGWLSFKGKDIRVSKALNGFSVALRASQRGEQAWDIYFSWAKIGQINLADSCFN
jgi:hypothetical protein